MQYQLLFSLLHQNARPKELQGGRVHLAHTLRDQSFVGEKAQQQEHGAAGHMAATVRKQREPSLCWCSAHFLLFIQSETPAHQMALPTFRVGLLSFFSQQSKSSLTDTPGGGLDASRSCPFDLTPRPPCPASASLSSVPTFSYTSTLATGQPPKSCLQS